METAREQGIPQAASELGGHMSGQKSQELVGECPGVALGSLLLTETRMHPLQASPRESCLW